LLTTDKNLPHQQNLNKFKIAIVILGNTKWSLIQLKLPEIVQSVNAAKSGTHTLIEIPER